jgi:hypothetical protein
VHWDVQITRAELRDAKAGNPNFPLSAPVGRFARKAGQKDIVAETKVREGQSIPTKVAAVLQAGFFESGGDAGMTDKFRDIKAGLDRFLRRAGGGQWIASSM